MTNTISVARVHNPILVNPSLLIPSVLSYQPYESTPP